MRNQLRIPAPQSWAQHQVKLLRNPGAFTRLAAGGDRATASDVGAPIDVAQVRRGLGLARTVIIKTVIGE